MVIEGKYKNGKKDGYGEYYTKRGDVLKCEWKEGKPDGHGRIVRSTGEEFDAQWKNGQLLLSKRVASGE